MVRRNSGRRRRRLAALATAVVTGAGVAFAYVVTGGTVTWPSEAAAPHTAAGTQSSPPSTTTTPPPPPPVLPFNAKLTSQDIPVKGGGVRSGACSGSLIAPQWVITAGHCFHDINDVRVGGPPQYTMSVVIGKLKDSDPGGHAAQVVDVRQSPLNDLAVVKLDKAVKDVVPLQMATTPPAMGQPLQFAGWGSLSATVLGPSDHLKRGQFTVSGIGEYTLEAQPVGVRTVENGPCPEDSGGPFFISDDDRTGMLVAIVNTGPPCPQPGAEIIARVDVVAGWIQQQIVA
ncbi:S1 family peptidase [Actinophytocola oryzae]|uniref:Trypsin n=1 Tax=Actinophytocola oryzae TaxID=502181 RepID=A0A4R7V2X1_9PSEU|nr:trypsin-like serine protease [Actinophytocola oryzae]TDV42185.1 trypsin [Actinophytocola oryzae]